MSLKLQATVKMISGRDNKTAVSVHLIWTPEKHIRRLEWEFKKSLNCCMHSLVHQSALVIELIWRGLAVFVFSCFFYLRVTSFTTQSSFDSILLVFFAHQTWAFKMYWLVLRDAWMKDGVFATRNFFIFICFCGLNQTSWFRKNTQHFVVNYRDIFILDASHWSCARWK